MENLINVMVNAGQVVFHGVTGFSSGEYKTIQLPAREALELVESGVCSLINDSDSVKLKMKFSKPPSALEMLQRENEALKAALKDKEISKDLVKEISLIKDQLAKQAIIPENQINDNEESEEELDQEGFKADEQSDVAGESDLDSFLKKKGKK